MAGVGRRQAVREALGAEEGFSEEEQDPEYCCQGEFDRGDCCHAQGDRAQVADLHGRRLRRQGTAPYKGCFRYILNRY